MRQEDRICAQILADPAEIGTPLFLIALDRFGADVFDWEPDTLNREFTARFGLVPPARNMDKIWALINVVSTDLFHSSLEAFIHVCNALSGEGADFKNYNPAEVREICWGITETSLIDPPEKENVSLEIPVYARAQLESEGFGRIPKILIPYVGDFAPVNDPEEALAVDGIDAKSYWDSQAKKTLEVDEYVSERLRRLLKTTISLPLLTADRKSFDELRTRVQKALEGQSLKTERESELVPSRPFS